MIAAGMPARSMLLPSLDRQILCPGQHSILTTLWPLHRIGTCGVHLRTSATVLGSLLGGGLRDQPQRGERHARDKGPREKGHLRTRGLP